MGKRLSFAERAQRLVTEARKLSDDMLEAKDRGEAVPWDARVAVAKACDQALIARHYLDEKGAK